MLVVSGADSQIIKELLQLAPDNDIRPVRLRGAGFSAHTMGHVPLDADRYVLASGVQHPRLAVEQSESEIQNSLTTNLVSIVMVCENVLGVNERARICVVGSISGYCGSYDGIYALSKAALHRYVETKRLDYPDQQLVAVAPDIIEDAGMTLRREDADVLEKRRTQHPKKRFLRAEEIARLIKFLLWDDQGYISNTVVKMTGRVGCHT